MPSRRRFLAATGAMLALGGCLDSIGSRSTPPTALAGSWTHADADAAGTLATDTPGFESAPSEAWSVPLDGRAPTLGLAGSDLLTATDARIAGRSLETGESNWTYAFEASGRLGAVLDTETVYATVGERDSKLQLLGQRDEGDAPMLNWADPGSAFRRADRDLVVAAAEDESVLVGVDPSGGSERWRLSAEELSVSAARFGDVALGPDHVFAVAENSGSVAWVYGLDRATGEPRWHDEGPNHAASLTVTDDRVLSGGFYGKVQGWHHDGSGAWTAETTPPVASIAARDGRAFASKNGRGKQGEPAITALDTDGSQLWTRTTGGVSAVDADAAYVVDDGVVAVDPASGEKRWKLGTDPGSVYPADGGLFVLSASDDRGATLRLFA